jgi:hypothetical protein
MTYLLLSGGGQGPRPCCSHPAGEKAGVGGGRNCFCAPGAGSARGRSAARTEVRGHTCDINLATGCVRALSLLLPSCGWQRRRAGAGGRGGCCARVRERRERRRWEGGARGGGPGGLEHKKQVSVRARHGAGLPKRQGSARARHRAGARSSGPTARA